MKKSIHSESEMVKAVKELGSGVSAEVVARDHGITRATLYNWKSKYSGMDVSQVKRLKERMNEKIISFQAVDLGLSVLWADRNLGASLPSVDGYHYRWGDLSLWKNENFYYQKGVFDNISNNIGGNPNFDAARYECGEPWRLPSLSEINELIHCCTWIWQEADDVNFVLSGYEVVGMNGNHIFLPTSGQGEGLMEGESYIEDFDIYGCYWSGNLCEDKYMAYELRFRKDAISVYPQWRSRGNCIRPVCLK